MLKSRDASESVNMSLTRWHFPREETYVSSFIAISSNLRGLNRHFSIQRADVLTESGLDFTEPNLSASPAQVTMFLSSVVAL
jgi:hypothetical protein